MYLFAPESAHYDMAVLTQSEEVLYYLDVISSLNLTHVSES